MQPDFPQNKTKMNKKEGNQEIKTILKTIRE